MNEILSQKEIGKRILALRKQKGWSQAELAEQVKLSRPSIAQIELGGRNVSALELHRFSLVLNFSIDQFLSPHFDIQSIDIEMETEVKEKGTERIAVPALKVEKFRNILLYVLERCAGKPNIGETHLCKLLYFSDFNYYELYEEHLSGATYKKLPFGPVPQNLDTIIQQMIQGEKLKRIKTDYHGYPQTRYIPLVKADLTLLKASEKEVLDKVIDQYSDWTASAISEYSHKDVPWLVSKQGDVIDYELAFYREVPYSVRTYDEE